VQIPECGITAPGFSPVPAVLAQAEILASAKALSQTKEKHPSITSGAVYAVGFHNANLGQKLLEPFPIIALALAMLVEILYQIIPSEMIIVLCQAWQVAMHTVVIEVTP
jgi:hypothetical protein